MKVPMYEPHPLMARAFDAAKDAQMKGHGSHGPEVAEFEHKLAEYWDVDPALVVCTDSCTSAMTVAHVVLRSNVVAVPSITWVATANAARMAGCTVLVQPVDECCMIMYGDDDAWRSRIDTVVPVAIYGQQVMDYPDHDHVRNVIVDNAQAFEAPPSSSVDASCYSFHTLKSLPIGVGGAVVFSRHHHADDARMVRFHGVNDSRRQWTEGWKGTMPAFAAAMGGVFLELVEEELQKRRQVVSHYDNAIRADIQVPRSPNDFAHAYVVRVRNRVKFRDELKKGGIDTSHYYPSLTSHPYHGEGKGIDEDLGDQLVAIPCSPRMTKEQADYVVAEVNAFGEAP